jgi:hypothetical protein
MPFVTPTSIYSNSRRRTKVEKRRETHGKSKPSSKRFYYDGRLICRLQSFQCTSNTKLGKRCKRRIVIGVDKCYHHIREYGVVIKDEGNFGKGLFAARDLQKNHNIPYFGELRHVSEINNAYPNEDDTAAYGIYVNKTWTLDAACLRSVGSLANHSGNKNKINMKLVVKWRGKNRVQETALAHLVLNKNVKEGTPLYCDYNGEFNDNQKYLFDNKHKTK